VSGKPVSLTIDGHQVQAEPGTTVFEAARRAGIDIPHLCHHPLLKGSGACRLCVVEVQRARSLLASCTLPVAPDMVVHTRSDRVVEARRLILDLILSNHPADCLTCESAGDCRLQEYAYEYGVKGGTFEGDRRRLDPDESNPFFIRDYDKCILCGRCVRVCDELCGVAAVDYGFRGFDTRVMTAFDDPLQETDCQFCGNCVEACPTGALQPRPGRGKARSWERRRVRTICPYCGVGCALELHVKDVPDGRGEVVGVGAADGPANHGLLCVKGRFGFDFINHPDRLTAPLIRREGRLERASWEEALDLVASRLKEAAAATEGRGVAVLSSARCTNEENYLLQKLARAALGSNNVDHCARLCHASTVVGLATAFGSGAMTNSIDEIEGADCIFVIGSNTTEAHPVIGLGVKRAQAAGATLICADPRRVELARRADIHLQQLPGTDVALLNAMMHVICSEGLADERFIKERTEGFAEVERLVREWPPERAAETTGVPAADIRRAARAFAGAEKGTILFSMGITQHTTGTDNVLSIADLALLTGNVGRECTGVNPLRGQNNVQGACDLGALPDVLPGYQKVDDAASRGRFERAWGAALSPEPGLTVVEMVNAAAAGEIQAMYIVGENPMVSDPDLSHVAEGLKGLDFLCVQDIFLTETAQLADVVLPAACFAEKEGTFTNTERRVQRIMPALPPPGEALPDWQIICRLGRRLGPGFDFTSPTAVMDEIAQLSPIYGGITYARLGTRGLQWPCPDRTHPGTPYCTATGSAAAWGGSPPWTSGRRRKHRTRTSR